MSTVRELLARATGTLADAGIASPRYDAEELLAHALVVPRLRLDMGHEPSAEQVDRFDALVARRAAREPLQHLLGSVAFRHVELAVGPGVFVPRPETEVVAGWVVDTLRAGRSGGVVVDLCTGTGAIALAVADEVPDAKVYAVEADPGAHAWAERNLAGSPVTLVLGDALDALPDLTGAVDLVVANPPYIPLTVYEYVEPEVRDHDPAMALWSGEDGLDAIRMVERAAARLLRTGGHAVVEHADVQGESAPAVFAGTGAWSEVRDHLDLAGRPRFVTARRTSDATTDRTGA